MSLSLLLADLLGINALCRFRNRKKAVVMWYHGVCAEDFTLLKDYDERHIPTSLFCRHLAFFRKKGYAFATITQLLEKRRRDEHGKHVVLTFDDGFRNIVDNAYPAMQKFGARGCFFLVSGIVGSDDLLWTDYVETVVRNQEPGQFPFWFKEEKCVYTLNDRRSYETAMLDIKRKLRSISESERREHMAQFDGVPLAVVPDEFRMVDWERIRSLDRDILEIGCHTQTHPNCANLTKAEEFDRELQQSKAEIEAQVGYDVDHFCYPAGSFNDAVIDHLKRYRFQSAAAVSFGFFDREVDLYRINRIDTNENFLYFKAAVSGSMPFVARLDRLLGLLPFLKGNHHG